MRVWAPELKIRFLEHQVQECWAEEEMLASGDPQTRQVLGTKPGTAWPGQMVSGRPPSEPLCDLG